LIRKTAIKAMSKEDEYRGFAASYLQFANASANIADKTRLLSMAEAWLDLARRARQHVAKSQNALWCGTPGKTAVEAEYADAFDSSRLVIPQAPGGVGALEVSPRARDNSARMPTP
jgi:hypothetical protein